ncbi:MAG: CHAT domain-containing protein, partial [Alphaproteobacteria bacterium]
RLLEFVQASLGLNLMKQGRLVEAEIEVRAALIKALKRTGRYGPNVAKFTADLSAVLAAQGRAADAEALARASIEINGAIGSGANSSLMQGTRFQLATALAAQQRWKDVLEQFEIMTASDADGSIGIRRRIEGSPLFGLALIETGQAAEAVRVTAIAVERNRRKLGGKHFETALAEAVSAVALAKTGEQEGALKAFRRAVPILLQRSRRSDEENGAGTLRARRIGSILETYIGVLADVRGTKVETAIGVDAAAEAFRLADVARSQSVQRALAASAVRAAAKDPALADLVRREQDALKQIGALNALYANAVSVSSDQQNPEALAALRDRVDTLRGARAALSQEIEKGFPEYSALIRPAPATVERTRAGLRTGEALILTYVARNRSFVWALPKSGAMQFAAVALTAGRMASIVRDLRRALDPAAATLGDIPAFDVALSHRLYRSLLEPVADGWRSARNLLMVSHGALGQLPLSVLVTRPVKQPKAKGAMFAEYRRVPWLARSHAVTVLPSVSALATLRRLPPPSKGRRNFVGFGDPVFNLQQAATPPAADPTALTSRGVFATRGIPLRLRAAPALEGAASATLARLPRLPDTAKELRGMALAMNADLTRDVFTGAAASEDRVKSMKLSGYRVLAFATHGLVPGNLDGLTQPALALSGPKVTGGKNDGLLTMGEILALKLDADWVVLSACNTASGQGAGAEAVSGLGRAFFYAGTRALLVSNWPVETTSARVLTTDLFRRQAAGSGLGRSASLRQA